MQRKDELLLDWVHARTHDEAIDAIIALGKHLRRRDYHERYVPGNGIDVPDEWEPIPFDEEPSYWDDLPEAPSERAHHRRWQYRSLVPARGRSG